MNIKLSNQVLITTVKRFGLVTLTTLTTIPIQPSYAEGSTFYCGTSEYKGKIIPTTFVRSQNGRRIGFIRWIYSSFDTKKLSTQQRCEVVSQRFQRIYDHGYLNGFIGGTLNGQPVICATNNQNHTCTDKTLLFTLKHKKFTESTLEALRSASRIIGEASGRDKAVNVDDTSLSDFSP
ncbi:MAG: COP23 domain-containing protein [Tolypothrix carrinoi HA7290-LM1]|jgi:hypothetical protein|nr:COP23 domain-containing protein [Tolypothrix carrinoi HA7290-LM1]